MKVEINNRCRGFVTLAVVSVLAISLVFVNVAIGAGTTKRLPQNAQGETFGTVAAASETGQYLDLVQVQATNGKMGYVYNDDLQSAESGGVSTPEQAEARMAERTAASEEAFFEELCDLLPGNQYLTLDNVRRYLDATVRAPIEDPIELKLPLAEREAASEMADAIGVPLDQLEEKLGKALDRARMRVQTKISVYESDGITKIGEFAIGSFL